MQRLGPRCGARLAVNPTGATGHPCTCCSFRHAAAPHLPPSPAPPPRCSPELLGRARVTEARKALGCRFRVQRGGGSAPGVPGAAAVGGDGKRKSGAARSRSRTLEELHACWDRRVDPSSVASKRPRAAERATLSRGRWPELGGINRMPPGSELGDEGRRPLLIVAVSSHRRRSVGLADSAKHPGQERQRDPKTDPGTGGGGRVLIV